LCGTTHTVAVRRQMVKEYVSKIVFLFLARQPPPPQWTMVSSFTRFLDHTQRRTTVGRTPRKKRTTLKTNNLPCPPVEFEPKISAGERPPT